MCINFHLKKKPVFCILEISQIFRRLTNKNAIIVRRISDFSSISRARFARERTGSRFATFMCRKNSAFDPTRKVHLMRPIERAAFHRASSNGARGMNPPKDDSPPVQDRPVSTNSTERFSRPLNVENYDRRWKWKPVVNYVTLRVY